jgi:hypothetical protein
MAERLRITILDIAKVGMVNNELLTGYRKYSSILNEWMVVGPYICILVDEVDTILRFQVILQMKRSVSSEQQLFANAEIRDRIKVSL